MALVGAALCCGCQGACSERRAGRGAAVGVDDVDARLLLLRRRRCGGLLWGTAGPEQWRRCATLGASSSAEARWVACGTVGVPWCSALMTTLFLLLWALLARLVVVPPVPLRGAECAGSAAAAPGVPCPHTQQQVHGLRMVLVMAPLALAALAHQVHAGDSCRAQQAYHLLLLALLFRISIIVLVEPVRHPRVCASCCQSGCRRPSSRKRFWRKSSSARVESRTRRAVLTKSSGSTRAH